MKSFSHSILCAIALLAGPNAWAQAIAGAGFALRPIDGDNEVGAHYAIVSRTGGATGFFYLADLGRLVASNCPGLGCNQSYALSNPATDRGRFVSVASRTALNERPFAAYYDASTGDLIGLDCQSSDCVFGIERTLESIGNIGQDTATVIDPASGFPLIAYYDVDNADLRLYRCASATCDSGSSVLVSGNNDRGRNVSMVFAGSTLWMAFEDRTSSELVLARSSAPYSSFALFSQLNGAEPSLSVNASGFLEMVWRETVGHTLQRLQCFNAICNSASQITLAGVGRGYRPSSTRLGNGNLLVSHFEPGAGNLRGTICNDAACSAPQALVFDSGSAIAGKSQARVAAGDLPQVYFHNAARADVDATQCTTAACTGFLKRTAFNGLQVDGARLALRSDGRAVVAYIRQRQPWLAQCADALCSALSRITIPGFNSDTRPALAIRPDGRPVIYYASLGGSELYDCADAACSAGTARMVSGSGNSTSNVLEMALRADGRPLLLYTVSNANDVFVFDCSDSNCSTGNARLLVDEPTGNGRFISGFDIVIGPGDRAMVLYSLFSNSGNQQRYVRCNDSACLSATAITVGANPNFFANPLALRADGRPAFLESTVNQYAICDNPDCSGIARFPTGTSGLIRTLVMQAGDRPLFEAGSIGIGYLSSCDDATCSALQQSILFTDSNPQSSYLGSLAINGAGVAYTAYEEQNLGDVVLVVPLPDAVFGNGFE